VRARKVHRVVRHIEPWSVLKVSVLFFLAVFLIICVASAILWNGARQAGSIEKVEDFITETGGFGTCPTPVTTPTATTAPGAVAPVTTTTAAVEAEADNKDCRDGQELQGAFKFEDAKIFEAFLLGGVVLVLAGSAGAVVLAMLFNLMSDLAGGVRVTVLEEEPRQKTRTGSPGSDPRG
jgi:hypothetical protein